MDIVKGGGGGGASPSSPGSDNFSFIIMDCTYTRKWKWSLCVYSVGGSTLAAVRKGVVRWGEKTEKWQQDS